MCCQVARCGVHRTRVGLRYPRESGLVLGQRGAKSAVGNREGDSCTQYTKFWGCSR